ncbi:hypothetical protein TDB9533_00475 [Thalassocella blandensis]|nr:hypothetical protein TDB9533_00475 [Thalassocella blandensis]
MKFTGIFGLSRHFILKYVYCSKCIKKVLQKVVKEVLQEVLQKSTAKKSNKRAHPNQVSQGEFAGVLIGMSGRHQ